MLEMNKYFVCYEYGNKGRPSNNFGWSIVDVTKTDTGLKEDIPEIYRLQDETHYFFLVEATNKEQAIKLSEQRHEDNEFKGLVI